ncbi:putative fatty acyl-CoA reductase CG5065 [Toxorhynchites rutilus septentrionalis]|uniref:putative fatty acyl-CoA reductase CG5065 n=1 Tax=Toxorhynchites rutilus septentrionalis TaxID=329112 RepID=UPI00247A0D28|nr:putative fatty acyl-CoA reductase CG5065 [Toxorhynchites rutilus septentrionalis]
MHTFSNHPIGLLPTEENYDPNKPTIAEFYSGRDIFVTGGTGFMGKVLIEKLLRSCGSVNRIFILMREKKQKTIQERIKDMQQQPLFDLLRERHKDALDKMIPVGGDVSLLGLGLSSEDIQMMRDVSIIFHVAASVRFDDPLKDAILMNTRGTREVMRLGQSLKNLCVLMHVSTTYSNPDRYVIEEKIFPAYADWRDTIKLAEQMDEETLDTFAPKYMSFLPNTYVFTKSLAEQIVDEYREELPLILFRPSIVISSMKDPIPGWMDNFNGPVGLLVGCGIGICRTMYCDPNNVADFTPVDVCIKAMIVAAWKKGTAVIQSTPISPESPQLPVYNCCISNLRNCTMGQIVDMGKTLSDEMPLDKCLWAPGGGITQIRIRNFIRVMLYHILPAILIDNMLKLTGQRPFLAKLQRKIYNANVALEYFILHNWDFKNSNFIRLASEIKPEDNKDFYYRDFIEFDITLYFRNCILGARRYLLNEKDENIPKALTNLRRLKIVDKVCKFLIACCFLYLIFIKLDLLGLVLYLTSYRTKYNLELEAM